MHNRLTPLIVLFSIGAIASCDKNSQSPQEENEGSGLTLSITKDDEGNVTNYTRYMLNDVGEEEKSVNYNGPGLDGVWLNDDDIVESYKLVVRDGLLNKYKIFTDAGVDGEWFTSDDILESYSTLEFNGDNNRIRNISYRDSGEDAQWFTYDDNISSYWAWKYDNKGRLGREDFYTSEGLGGDLEWFTLDDIPRSYLVYTYDNDGNNVRSTYYRNPGVDLKWFTTDDVPSSYNVSEYDQSGKVVIRSEYTGLGNDSVWFTDDDILYEYYRSIYDSSGNIEKYILYINKGADSVWFTADDKYQGYVHQEYDDENKLVKSSVFYATDLNLDQFELHSYSTYEYLNGLLSSTNFYTGKGADEEWFTEDDVLTTRSEYSICVCETPIFPLVIFRMPSFFGPGSGSGSVVYAN